MARAGMTSLLEELRNLTESTDNDYTVGTTTYWSDDQLQNVLDKHRTDLNRESLRPEVEYDGGTSIWKDYYAPRGHLEQASSEGGAAVWSVEDADGDEAGTANYTVNYLKGHIRFSSDQNGESYYLRARSYDLYSAAAEIWRIKAGWRVKHVTFTADDQVFKQSDWFRHCLIMASQYEGMAGPKHRSLRRNDLT
jgi:hypothetical protein